LDAHGCLENYAGVERLDLEFRDWPPNYDNPDGNNFIIYCDTNDWVTNGRYWASKDGKLVFKDEDAGQRGTLCGMYGSNARALANSIESDNLKMPLVFLCDIIKPPTGQQTGLAYPLTYSTMHRHRMLGYGRYFDAQMRYTTSFFLVHEMLHVARGSHSQYRSF
jgi:hypothetical protein